MVLSSPMVVMPSMKTWAIKRVPRPIVTSRPDNAIGTDFNVVGDLRAGIDARGVSN